MPVLLTSFTAFSKNKIQGRWVKFNDNTLEISLGSRIVEYDYEAFSVATSQPKGSKLETLPFLFPVKESGERIRGEEDLENARKEILDAYYSRREQIKNWIESLDNSKYTVLCCWCPYTNFARAYRKKNNGLFACHTGLIGILINLYAFNKIDIIVDGDREKLLNKWSPKYFNIYKLGSFDEERKRLNIR